MQFYPLEGKIARTDPTLVIEGTASNVKDTSGPLTFGAGSQFASLAIQTGAKVTEKSA